MQAVKHSGVHAKERADYQCNSSRPLIHRFKIPAQNTILLVAAANILLITGRTRVEAGLIAPVCHRSFILDLNNNPHNEISTWGSLIFSESCDWKLWESLLSSCNVISRKYCKEALLVLGCRHIKFHKVCRASQHGKRGECVRQPPRRTSSDWTPVDWSRTPLVSYMHQVWHSVKSDYPARTTANCFWQKNNSCSFSICCALLELS